MATNFWNFANIKSTVREVVGLPSTTQLSEDDLETAINRYYFYQFPMEAKPFELQDYWSFSTTAGISTKSFDDDSYSHITGDGWIDGYPFEIYFDPQEWFERWPETNSYSQTRPEQGLFYARQLTMNPPPDGVYTVKIPVYARPQTFSLDSDTPAREEWGPAIAYGAAMEILLQKGNAERAQEIWGIKGAHLRNLQGKQAETLSTERAMPRW